MKSKVEKTNELAQVGQVDPSNIPGLTKSQQKKALRKAKERAKKEESNLKNVNKEVQLSSSILTKQAELSCNDEINSEFEFSNVESPALTSKFFRKVTQNNPAPPGCNLEADRTAEREEVWEKYMYQRKSKRSRDSPENDRKGAKKPLLH